MKIHMLRVSLQRSKQIEMFESEPDREIWIRQMLSKAQVFEHRGQNLVYRPLEFTDTETSQYIIGQIAKQKLQKEWSSPSEGLVPIEHHYWDAALVLVDPSDHSDGQKIGMQRDTVGEPPAVLSSLFATLHRESQLFIPKVYSIVETGSFADFISDHAGALTRVRFEVAMPNMFRSPTLFNDEMTRLRAAGVTDFSSTLKSDDGGIDAAEVGLNDVVPHIERGGGKADAEASDGSKYSSEDHPIVKDLDVNLEEFDTPGFVGQILAFLDRTF